MLESMLSLDIFVLKSQRRGIDTETQTRRLRSVFKHVAQMGAAMFAMNLGAPSEPAVVRFGFDVRFVGWLPETRPTRPRIKLRVRFE